MFNPFSKIPTANPDDVVEKIGKDGVLLIDVRSRGEYDVLHARGAVNIPLETIPENAEKLKSYAEVYLICQSGGRSGEATRYLMGAGVNAINVSGGTRAWKESSLPVQ